MAAYRRVYDSRHLQADCQEPGSAQELYAQQLRKGCLFKSVMKKVYDSRHLQADCQEPGSAAELYARQLSKGCLIKSVMKSETSPSFL